MFLKTFQFRIIARVLLLAATLLLFAFLVVESGMLFPTIAVFLIAVFILIRKGRITSGNRKWLYIAAVGVFGVFLGSDPSPMGTVKDAIVLFGSKGVIFPPS